MVDQDIQTKRAELLERLEQLEREQQLLTLDDERDVEKFRKRINDIRTEAAALMETQVPNKK